MCRWPEWEGSSQLGRRWTRSKKRKLGWRLWSTSEDRHSLSDAFLWVLCLGFSRTRPVRGQALIEQVSWVWCWTKKDVYHECKCSGVQTRMHFESERASQPGVLVLRFELFGNRSTSVRVCGRMSRRTSWDTPSLWYAHRLRVSIISRKLFDRFCSYPLGGRQTEQEGDRKRTFLSEFFILWQGNRLSGPERELLRTFRTRSPRIVL